MDLVIVFEGYSTSIIGVCEKSKLLELLERKVKEKIEYIKIVYDRDVDLILQEGEFGYKYNIIYRNNPMMGVQSFFTTEEVRLNNLTYKIEV